MAASSKPTGKRAIWTAEEVDLLGSLVVDGDQNRRQVILSKGLQGDDRKKKKAAWDSVADEFNMRASVLDVGYSGWMRSAEQIKQRWHKGRSEAKNQNAVAKASVVSTGGGKIGVDKHLQNYLQGLSEEELEGCNDEEYGSVNLEEVEIIEEMTRLAGSTSSTSKDPEGSGIQLTSTVDDEPPALLPIAAPSASASTAPQSVSAIVAKSGNGEFSLKRRRPTSDIRQKGCTSTPKRKKQGVSKDIEDTLLEEELKVTKLWKRVLRIKLEMYRKTLSELGLDEPGSEDDSS